MFTRNRHFDVEKINLSFMIDIDLLRSPSASASIEPAGLEKFPFSRLLRCYQQT